MRAIDSVPRDWIHATGTVDRTNSQDRGDSNEATAVATTRRGDGDRRQPWVRWPWSSSAWLPVRLPGLRPSRPQ